MAVNTLCPAASNTILTGRISSALRGTFVTLLELARSIIDTELLKKLAVNTLCPAASNAISNGPSPPEAVKFTFVTELSVRSIIDIEPLLVVVSLSSSALAVNTLCPAASNTRLKEGVK